MTHTAFANLPPWAMPLDLGAHAVAGVALGWLYFYLLWCNARHFAERGRIATIGGLALARFAVLGGLLALVSLEGAPPLLATALGVLIARSVMLRRFSAATP
jgi:F1F0 ATPase subunit 2